MKNGMMSIEEVAVVLQCSVNTINSWYRFRAQNPNNEYAKLLPSYVQGNSRTSSRYWDRKDIWKFIEFRTQLPKGRNGVMGSVTQKYVKHKKEDKT